MTWGYTFGYRRRMRPRSVDGNKPTVELPADLLELMGVEDEASELLATLTEDGSLVVRLIR